MIDIVISKVKNISCKYPRLNKLNFGVCGYVDVGVPSHRVYMLELHNNRWQLLNIRTAIFNLIVTTYVPFLHIALVTLQLIGETNVNVALSW